MNWVRLTWSTSFTSFSAERSSAWERVSGLAMQPQHAYCSYKLVHCCYMWTLVGGHVVEVCIELFTITKHVLLGCVLIQFPEEFGFSLKNPWPACICTCIDTVFNSSLEAQFLMVYMPTPLPPHTHTTQFRVVRVRCMMVSWSIQSLDNSPLWPLASSVSRGGYRKTSRCALSKWILKPHLWIER